MACYHHPLTANMVERRRAWHAITALGQHTRSTTSGVACHHSPWTASGVACHHYPLTVNMVERRRAWHNITALGQHTWSKTSGVVCHHSPWTAHTVGRRQALHASIAFGKHTRSNDVGRGLPSSPLGSTHSRPMSGVACHHRLWEAQTAERRRAWHAIIALG